MFFPDLISLLLNLPSKGLEEMLPVRMRIMHHLIWGYIVSPSDCDELKGLRVKMLSLCSFIKLYSNNFICLLFIELVINAIN